MPKYSKINLINPQELIPYEKNAKLHDQEQIETLAKLIENYGFPESKAILVDENLVIVCGHGRRLAAIEAGLKKVPYQIVSQIEEPDIKALRISDNAVGESEWDYSLLKEEYQDLEYSDIDLDLLALDDVHLEAIEFLQDGGEDKDEDGDESEDVLPEENTIEPKVKQGSVWQLGEHRLMCGDSNNLNDIKTLLGHNQIDMLFTDPPYGINESGDRTNRNNKNRLGKSKKFANFQDDSIEYAIKAFELTQELNIPVQVWFGANYYCHSLPQTNNWLVWDKRVEEKQHDHNSDCELAWVKNQHSSVRIFRHLWKGCIKESESNKARIHPTQKPVALIEWCFAQYAPESVLILDLFTGSGSTLIACENNNRIFFGMEISEHYCDVIIKRWEEYTGKIAKLIQ